MQVTANFGIQKPVAISRTKDWPKNNKIMRAKKTLGQNSTNCEAKNGSIELKKKTRGLPL